MFTKRLTGVLGGLFAQVVLHGVVNMQLPNQWLWDMVDEFVYQFQSFCQYRAKMKNKTEQEIALLRQYDQVILSPVSLVKCYYTR